MENQESRISKTILKRKGRAGEVKLPDFKANYKKKQREGSSSQGSLVLAKDRHEDPRHRHENPSHSWCGDN